MDKRPIVILDGWSDTSAIFELLTRFVRAKLRREISIITLADHSSLEDEVRFDDGTTAMQTAWEKHEPPKRKGGVDAIAHSTGDLVIRDRLERNYMPGRALVKHLVMLAPANFGSPGCRVLQDTS